MPAVLAAVAAAAAADSEVEVEVTRGEAGALAAGAEDWEEVAAADLAAGDLERANAVDLEAEDLEGEVLVEEVLVEEVLVEVNEVVRADSAAAKVDWVAADSAEENGADQAAVALVAALVEVWAEADSVAIVSAPARADWVAVTVSARAQAASAVQEDSAVIGSVPAALAARRPAAVSSTTSWDCRRTKGCTI